MLQDFLWNPFSYKNKNNFQNETTWILYMREIPYQAPFTSEIVGSILATGSCENRGFSSGVPVSSHRES
jgi:hypothetical protein